jgi:hypothetical protein
MMASKFISLSNLAFECFAHIAFNTPQTSQTSQTPQTSQPTQTSQPNPNPGKDLLNMLKSSAAT